MADKKLKRLSRADLLEMLLVQTKEVERLREKLTEMEKQLQERQLRINNAGSLAQAVIEVNKVVEAAQAAADQYLENIAAMEAEAKIKCRQLIQETLEKADSIRKVAKNGK